MANVKALGQTLAELRRMGRIEKVDAAKVAALRTMARSLDEKPYNSQMFHEYFAALEGLTTDGNADGAVEALLAELSSEVRDTPPS